MCVFRNTGNDILKLIKGCSHEGWTVVTTIHNPSAHMMNHLDGLILLVASNVIWFGPYNREEIYSTYESKVRPERTRIEPKRETQKDHKEADSSLSRFRIATKRALCLSQRCTRTPWRI